MRYIFLIVVLLLTSCSTSKKEETTEDSSNVEQVYNEENYPFDPAVEGVSQEKVAEEKVSDEAQITKLSERDTIGDLSNFLQKTIIHWKSGDINSDAVNDFIVVLQSTEKPEEDEDIYDAYQRKVVLLETIEEHPNYTLRGVNTSLVDCLNCGGAGVGDPFQGIAIKNNYFSIEQLYGACSKTFIVTTFKYDKSKDNWFLHKVGQEDYSCIVDDDSDGEIKVTHKSTSKKDFGEVAFVDFNSEDY